MFEARELGGPDHNERAPVYLDCWEDYLERDRIAARPAVKSAAKTAGPGVSKTKASPAKLAAKGHAVKPAAKSASRSRAAAKKGRKR